MVRYLTTPFDEKEIASLRIGDVVYLSGRVFTMRDKAHNRLFEASDKGEPITPVLQNAAVWHCGPVMKKTDGNWEVSAAGSTTSFRFSNVTPRLLTEFGVKALIGKGGLSQRATKSIAQNKAVFLTTVGGCAGVYKNNIKQVIKPHWIELGLAEAIWELEAEQLGALIVAIDSTGQSLYDKTKQSTALKTVEIYRELGVSPSQEYIYFPLAVPGLPAVSEYFDEFVKDGNNNPTSET